jgi:branched-subunit amino acid ABC-type transport system permease component
MNALRRSVAGSFTCGIGFTHYFCLVFALTFGMAGLPGCAGRTTKLAAADPLSPPIHSTEPVSLES